MLRALEQIRRMRGGARSHLMRCDDGNYYIVKLQNKWQHRRVLVNELLGTRLAGRLGPPTGPAEIVEVSEELIRLTPELAMGLPRLRVPCRPGLQFRSRYPVDPRRIALHDLLAACIRKPMNPWLVRLRDDLEDRFQSANGKSANGSDWQSLLATWDNTLSNALQLSPQKGMLA